MWLLALVLLTQVPPPAAAPPPELPVRKHFAPFADPNDLRPVYPVPFQVGEEADVDAGPAQGLFCDDLTLFSWTTEGPTHLVFKGVKVGTTLCRLGVNQPGYPTRLIELRIEAAAGAQPRRASP